MAMIGLGVDTAQTSDLKITPAMIEAWQKEGKDATGTPYPTAAAFTDFVGGNCDTDPSCPWYQQGVVKTVGSCTCEFSPRRAAMWVFLAPGTATLAVLEKAGVKADFGFGGIAVIGGISIVGWLLIYKLLSGKG